jgi:predicted dehydrogenase
MSARMRVAVIGARRRRQGIGAHLARFLVEAGADVRALVGTRPDAAAEAVATLERGTGHRARPSCDAETLLAEEPLDALVIASPHATHAPYLRLALRHRLHVLCEKPLVWGMEDPGAEARTLGEAFLRAGRHLVVNAQWPFTLPGYRALHPDATPSPERFWMRMSPRSSGFDMLLDVLPHPLSLLHAVAGPGRIESARIDPRPGVPEETLDVRFAYSSGTRAVAAHVEIVRSPGQPGPAGYGFDGLAAHREVQVEGYRLSFRSGGRTVALPDPTPLLVRAFLASVALGPPAAIDPAVVPGMEHLAALCAAYAGADVWPPRTGP